MAYATRAHGRDDDHIGTGRATGGAIGIFAALGLGIALLAAIAAYAVGDVTGDLGDGTTSLGANDFAGSLGTLGAGVFPFVAAPLVALLAGVWAGTATRSGGQGAIAGGLGSLVGTIVLFLLVGIGLAIGAGAAGAQVPDAVRDYNVPQNLENLLGYIGSVSGLVYLLAVTLTGLIAGAIIGGLMPRWTTGAVSRERVVDDRPIVQDRIAAAPVTRDRIVDDRPVTRDRVVDDRPVTRDTVRDEEYYDDDRDRRPTRV